MGSLVSRLGNMFFWQLQEKQVKEYEVTKEKRKKE